MATTTDKSKLALRAKIPLPWRAFGAPTSLRRGGMGTGCEDVACLTIAGGQLDRLIFIIALFVFGIRGRMMLAVFRCEVTLAEGRNYLIILFGILLSVFPHSLSGKSAG